MHDGGERARWRPPRCDRMLGRLAVNGWCPAHVRSHASSVEEIEWNAPSFHHGEHCAAFNLRSKEHVLLVIHAGTKPRPDAAFRDQVPDPTGLVEWLAADRCVVKFTSVSDVKAKAVALRRFLDAWVDGMA